ncbi:MAG: ASCH domain-containing protein [Spirochaetota bacterium]
MKQFILIFDYQHNLLLVRPAGEKPQSRSLSLLSERDPRFKKLTLLGKSAIVSDKNNTKFMEFSVFLCNRDEKNQIVPEQNKKTGYVWQPISKIGVALGSKSLQSDIVFSLYTEIVLKGYEMPKPVFQVRSFGDSDILADELSDLVLHGNKRAKSVSLWSLEAEKQSIPKPGDVSVLTDWDGFAQVIIETTEVKVAPFKDVPADFAAEEGEGDLSLEYWRTVHWDAFSRESAVTGRGPDEAMPVVCERFKVLHRLNP